MTMPADQIDEKSIFNIARRIDSRELRAEYLQQACGGNPEALERLAALLQVHDQEQSFLESPAVAVQSTTDQPPPERPGTQIGPYKLLQQIGEGGMGDVYMAEQSEPVKRRVALKIIKPGMDSRQVIARFEAEKQALALMDHANIARVLDAGTTEQGRPYFVMELVHGVSITKYCDDSRLTPRQRLELFLPVCQAIQHAHQKGIIHRDIKPSNVMVTLYDGQPVPKVIDFGVAKATEQKLTEQTLFTQYGTMVGTLEYMSPEQAEMSALGVDTRSDIYSLGVLLYELLTGSTPLSRQQMKDAAYAEILRLIKEEEPPKPSTRLSESGESLASISALRHTEPAKLSKLMRGELDWIVMKTLEKDRNRRYESAGGFAADVQRYLNDEPVQACPPSAAYRVRKFARRNKAALTMTSMVAVAVFLIVGGIGWTIRDRAARDREIEREQQARQARLGDQVGRIIDEAERLEKEQKWSDALATVKRAEDLAAGGELGAAQQGRLAQTLTDLNLVQRLDEIRLWRSELHDGKFDRVGTVRQYAEAFRDHGVDVETLSVEQAVRQLQPKQLLSVELGTALADWALMQRGIPAPAKDESVQRLIMLANAVDSDPWRQRLRKTWVQGNGADAKVLKELAASAPTEQWPPSTRVLLASVLQSGGLQAEAVQVLREAVADHPGDFWSNYRLGSLLFWGWTGDPNSPQRKECSTYYRVALGIRPRSALVCHELGVSLLSTPQRSDESIRWFRKAIEMDPKYVNAQHDLGRTLSGQRKFDEAIAWLRKAVELEPSNASAHHQLGLALLYNGQRQESIVALGRGAELGSFIACETLGNIHSADGRLNEALDCYRKGLAMAPTSVDANNLLAWFLATCADSKLQDPQLAVQLAESAMELGRRPKHPPHKSAAAARTLGAARYRSGDWKAAITALEESMELRQGGDSSEWFFLAMAHWQLGEREKAREWYDKAAQWMDKNPPDEEQLRRVGGVGFPALTGFIPPPDELPRFRAEAAKLLGIEDKPNPN